MKKSNHLLRSQNKSMEIYTLAMLMQDQHLYKSPAIDMSTDTADYYYPD